MTRLLKITCTLVGVAFTLAASSLFAQTKEIENQRKKIEKLEEDISYLDSQIQAVQEQKSNTMEELVLIQSKIANRKTLLAELDKEIRQHSIAITNAQNEISDLNSRLDTLELYYRNMVYNAYKHRDTKLWFMYILASNNMEQGYRRWSYLKNYSKSINDQAEKIREIKREREQKVKNVQVLKSNAIAAQAIRTKEYNTLAKEEIQSKEYARTLDAQQNVFEQQLEQKRLEADKLAKEVESLIAAEVKRQQEIARKQAELAKKQAQKASSTKPSDTKPSASKATASTTTNNNTQVEEREFQEFAAAEKLSGSFALNKGKLPYPVATGIIVEKFGEHPHPTLKNVKLPFNNGINISTRPASKVKAVFEGVVKQIIAIPGYNQCILVQHGKYFTFYCKLAITAVKVGDKVSTGTELGTLESHESTATLHFELWNGTTKQNPELWLKK